MAQTFIAGVSGALTDAVLRLQGTAQTVNVALTPVDSFGRPAAASPLATASVTGALQPSPAVDVAVAFPVPAKVERGQTYALVVNALDEDGPNGVHVGWAADLGYFFTDDQGTHCTNGAYPWAERGRTVTTSSEPMPTSSSGRMSCRLGLRPCLRRSDSA
jgi:hypothetical protein